MVNVSSDDLDRMIKALEIYNSVGDKLDELIRLTMRFHNGR